MSAKANESGGAKVGLPERFDPCGRASACLLYLPVGTQCRRTLGHEDHLPVNLEHR